MRTKKHEETFIEDLYGFCCFSVLNNKDAEYTLGNVIHDLSEWFHHRSKDWFSPRTTGYRKHIPKP